MSKDLLHLMRSLLAPTGLDVHGAAWHPAADVYQTRDGWLVKFDLAGVRPEDVQLVVSGKRLTVRGKRRDASIQEGCHCYRMEIAYSHFERSLELVELPYDLEQSRITTEYREGMLLVRIQPEQGGPA